MKTWEQVSERLGRNDMPLALVIHFNSMSRDEQAKGIEEEDAWDGAMSASLR
jgi:hypothetical protein